MYFQCEVQLMLAYLVQAVVDETLLNKHEYVTFFNGSISDLYCSLMAYVRERTYDTSFGDLVPHILANALCVDIIIVVRNNDGSYVTDHYRVQSVLLKMLLSYINTLSITTVSGRQETQSICRFVARLTK